MECLYLTMKIWLAKDNGQRRTSSRSEITYAWWRLSSVIYRNVLIFLSHDMSPLPFHNEDNQRILPPQANIAEDTTLIYEGPRQHTARRIISRSHPSSGDFFSSTCAGIFSSALSVQIDHFRTFSADNILDTLFRHRFVCSFLLICRQYLSGNLYSTAAVPRRNIPVLSPLLYKARD